MASFQDYSVLRRRWKPEFPPAKGYTKSYQAKTPDGDILQVDFHYHDRKIRLTLEVAGENGRIYVSTIRDGSILKEYKPLQVRRVIDEEVSKQVLDIMTGVLSDRGTGYKARLEGYDIAGKTGTAQIADTVEGGYLENQFYASFVGILPVQDPKIVILVTLDRPVGESYGGQTAAPIFRNIVERIAPYLNILPSFSEIYILQ